MLKLASHFFKYTVYISILLTVTATTQALSKEYNRKTPLKVALIIGALGDKSFFDSAAAGMAKAEADLPVDVDIIATEYKRDTYRATLEKAAADGYDVVIAGTYDYTGYITEIAPKYPDVRFIDYDDKVDYSSGCCSNVLSIEYQTSGAAYLAGYVAAKMSSTGILGTIVGGEYPPVMDFQVGFTQGAKAANPDIQVINTVADTFSDKAVGKKIALEQLAAGADVIFPVASFTGLGALEAVKDAGKLAVGVDSDQASMFATTDQGQADVIITSVEKDVGLSLFMALQKTVLGTQEFGIAELQGLEDRVVLISDNEQYRKLVPPALRGEVADIRSNILDGKIIVTSTMR